jgi:uncharacterized membrane protein YbaN (DUF454 family)
MVKNISKIVWIFVGTICVGLGALGIFLPVLPATPFFLLAAFCYGRGSQRFQRWLVYRSWVGSYIQNYQSGRGIPRSHMVLTIVFLWLTIGVTVIFVVLDWWLRIAALIAATGVTIHLTRMKTQQTTFPKHADTTHSIGSLDEVN